MEMWNTRREQTVNFKKGKPFGDRNVDCKILGQIFRKTMVWHGLCYSYFDFCICGVQLHALLLYSRPVVVFTTYSTLFEPTQAYSKWPSLRFCNMLDCFNTQLNGISASHHLTYLTWLRGFKRILLAVCAKINLVHLFKFSTKCIGQSGLAHCT